MRDILYVPTRIRALTRKLLQVAAYAKHSSCACEDDCANRRITVAAGDGVKQFVGEFNGHGVAIAGAVQSN